MLQAWALTLLFLLGSPAAQAQPAPAPTADARPRIGLVLSGGGARGLAHIGVLKALERAQVPVDFIAGTSMGAIIGGLYASGMSAEQLERTLLQVRWDDVFSNRVSRQELSQRRKEEDFEISPLIELGVRDGELRTPLAAVSSRGLETLLRRFTLPVRGVRQFDRLPIPFRAVATDMETGQAVILSEGDLARALRSSMSVPGVFAPIEVEGRVLGDGGLVNNLPVDVVRAMGADIVIAVNAGTPLASRESLSSVLGLTAQMINILTEQNVQRSLASLSARDALLSPQLGLLTASDFEHAGELIALGEQAAQEAAAPLARLALNAQDYAAWREQRLAPPSPATRLASVSFSGSTLTRPERLQGQLESQPGKAFDPAKAERDTQRLAASGDYTRADYRLTESAQGDGLVFDLEDKPWGPNYLRIGLDLSTDLRGHSAFNLKLSHNRRWLTASGTEWRNRVQIGEVPLWFSELYHPLNGKAGSVDDWFVAPYAAVERRVLTVYDRDSGRETAVFHRWATRAGVDLGQPWGRLGELRLGLAWRAQRTSPDILSPELASAPDRSVVSERGVRVRAVIDQLDFALFPQHGYRLEAEAMIGRSGRSDDGDFRRLEAQASVVGSAGRHTLDLSGMALAADTDDRTAVGRYSLGGFHQLSGYKSGQLLGNYVLFSRLTWYMRLSQAPAVMRGLFLGASLEAGNAWRTRGEARLGDLRSGMSVFIGADTGLGPAYLGLTHAPRGSSGLALFIGRP